MCYDFHVQGSTVARQASEKERAKGLPTYKDNDFLGDGRLIQVGEEKRKKLIEIIQADTEVCTCLCLLQTTGWCFDAVDLSIKNVY